MQAGQVGAHEHNFMIATAACNMVELYLEANVCLLYVYMKWFIARALEPVVRSQPPKCSPGA